jgi:predicted PurR-regulated permease PerM
MPAIFGGTMGEFISRNPILLFFLACFIGSAILLGWLFLPFIAILILGAVVTGIFLPLYRFINRHPKIRPSFASLLTCILIFFVLFVPIVFFVGSLTQQAYGLYQKAQGAAINQQIDSLFAQTHILERANYFLSKFEIEITGDELKKGVSEAAKFVGLFLFEQARAIASNTLAFLVNFFLMLMVIFFLLLDGDKLVTYIIDLSPLPTDQEQKLIGKFSDIAGAILIGNGLGGFIQGALGGMAFWLFGLPSAFLWGVIMGLLAFLPIIGIGMVFIPTSIYLVLKGRIAAGIFFLIFYVLLSMGIEYIFKPKLVGKRVKMHPLLVFFAIIGGLKLFGILGIIYGPLVVTAFLTLAEIYRSSYQQLVENKDS